MLANADLCDMLRAEQLAADIFSAAFFYEESSNGKERWRTDEVGNRGNDLQGQRAVPQAGGCGIRVTQRHHQEEPAWSWPVHAARPSQDEGCEEARHEGARRHQPLHEGKDGFQGEAGLQEGPRSASEEPQGARELSRYALRVSRRAKACYESPASKDARAFV